MLMAMVELDLWEQPGIPSIAFLLNILSVNIPALLALDNINGHSHIVDNNTNHL